MVPARTADAPTATEAAARRAGRPAAPDRQFVTALARGLEILRCFGPGDRTLGNQELSRRTGLPKPTVSRLTHTLTKLGYLRRSRTLDQYALGAAVLSLGYSMVAQMDVRRVARPLMQALAEHTGASVNLGARDRLSMIYIDTYRNAATFTVQLESGSRIPVATTSMGRAYLAGLREPERRDLLDQIRKAEGREWPRVKKGIDQALRDHADRGLCFSLGDWRPEIHAVAAPLPRPDDGEVLVFSCSGASFQMGRDKLLGEVGPRLLNLVGNVRTAMTNP